jgi:membrane associated rhomboid family serine protease
MVAMYRYSVAHSSYSMLPPVIRALLVANILIYLAEAGGGARVLFDWFALWPAGAGGSGLVPSDTAPFRPWQLISYAFLHGSIIHLFLNMYALWLFGVRLENLWGSRAFALYYFVCVIGAGATQLIIASYAAQYGTVYPTIGASGGVFGVLLAFGLIFPNEILLLIFPPVPVKAKWFVVGYGALELWAGITGSEAGVAHFAHLGGMLFGYLLLRTWHVRSSGRLR